MFWSYWIDNQLRIEHNEIIIIWLLSGISIRFVRDLFQLWIRCDGKLTLVRWIKSVKLTQIQNGISKAKRCVTELFLIISVQLWSTKFVFFCLNLKFIKYSLLRCNEAPLMYIMHLLFLRRMITWSLASYSNPFICETIWIATTGHGW